MISKTILIIEDDDGLLELLCDRMEDFDFSIVCKRSAQEALSWLTTNSPSLMILDYGLPDMNGMEFILELKKQGTQLPPFIVSTGQGDERIAVEMMKLGARDYVVKDIHFLEMLPMVATKIHSNLENEKKLIEAEQQIVDLDQFNKQIIKSAHEGIIVYDTQMNYQVWNPFMEKLTGLSAETVIGKNPLEFFPFLESSGVIGNIKAALNGKSIIDVEFPYTIPSTNKQGWASDSTAPLYNTNNEIIGVITTVRDITERKKSELALKDSEEKYRTIFENIQDVFYQVDMDGIILDISPSIKYHAGFDRNEMIGTPIANLYCNPAERSQFVEAILKLGELRDWEIKIRSKTNIIKYVSVNAQVNYNSKGQPKSINGALRDITERKLSEIAIKENEEKLRLVFDTIEEGIALNELVYNEAGEIDDYRILEVNPAFERMLHKPKDQIIGKLATELYPLSKEYISNFWKNHLNTTIELKTEIFTERTQRWNHVSTSQPSSNKFVTSTFDITERKNLEESIKQNELKLRTVTDYTYDWEYWLGPEKQIIYMSPSCFRITGYTVDEFTEKPNLLKQIIHPDDQEIYSVHHLGVYSIDIENEINDIEFRIIRKDGSIVYLHHICRPIFDANKVFLGRRVSNREITTQKAMELQLRESEYFFKQSQIAGNIGSYKTDFITGYWISSEVLDQIWGIDKDYVRSVQGWLDLVHPQDQEMMSTFLTEEVIGKRKRFDKEYRIIRKSDGVTRWVHGLGESEFNEDGQIVSLIGTVMDVTDRIEADQQLKLLSKAIEQTPVSIVVTDFNGFIEYVNPKFTEVTGYTFDEAIGENPRILNAGTQSKEYYKNLWDTILSGKDWYGEFQNKTKNGEHYWESVVISPIFNSIGDIEHFIAIKEDITHLKRLNEKLVHSLQKAEENERLKSAFLQNMSHEIRTPMNAIIGFSNLLNKPSLPSKRVEKYTGAIVKSTKDLLSKITDILTISSLETNQESISIVPVSVNQMLEELTLQFTQSQTYVPLICHYALSEADAEIYTDKTKLHQIINQLLRNAFKFTDEGKIEMGYLLKSNPTNSTKAELLFYVKDTGIGIDSKWHTKIFERFVQSDGSTHRKFEGNGIGLSISKGFVELLGGKIWVESELGDGSEFYFTIPYTPVKKPEPEIFEASTGSSDFRPTVLVAEDEYFNLLLIEEFLEEFDVEIIHAQNGKEAIQLYIDNPDIKLIIMDIKMPEMNGDEAAIQIKKINRHIPIIAQSAYALDTEIKNYQDFFDEYITKPLNLDYLKLLINKYLKI